MHRLLPPILALLFVLSMALASRLLPGLEVVPARFRLAGIVPFVAGAALVITARARFARARTNIYTFRDPGVLVTDGLFAYTRNPMYLGLSLALLGVAIGFGSAAALLLAAAYVVVTDRWYIAFEERALARKFGDDYLRYAQRTRRWL
jgi:protein-S-isoprenylcysteine O-methyltransferase Ste14